MQNKSAVDLIDDQPEMLEIFSELLGEEFQLRIFSEPEKLLQKIINRDLPRVIVSDLNMPVQNGLELSTKILRIDPTVKIILLSGGISKDVSIQACNLGIFAILEKPVGAGVLAETIRRAVSAHILNEMQTDFRNKAADFIQNADELVTMYKSRAADAEFMLKQLGLLPQDPEVLNERLLEATELSNHVSNLRLELKNLQSFKTSDTNTGIPTGPIFKIAN